MTNLYEETLHIFTEHSKQPQDVLFVKFKNNSYTTIYQFLEIAKTINYDAGYGLQEISENIYIVGHDWWLERAEYDGAEWWEYKQLPQKDVLIQEKMTAKDININYESE